ncbi:MAG TPA: lysyl oxidase family protein [Mycobacteriales bacterium]|nr:lysyl oxidase family protein [Mycobacteriales bacterium]
MTATVLVGGLLNDAVAAPKPPPPLRLALGGSVFWDLEQPESETALPACERRACLDFDLSVARGGKRLRVAMDTDGNSTPEVEVFNPAGKQVAVDYGFYSAEVYVPNPAPGRYVVRVRGAGSESRFRARLERVVPKPPRDGKPLLPNLRLVPPYEFTMAPEAAAGFDLLGCNAYEKAEYGARRCLRFSLGPANVGHGPFMLKFPAMSGLVAAEPVYQLIAHSDGRVTERQAGTALYHKTHAHHHHNGFGSLHLLKVVDPRRGRMIPAGTGPKQGFCMLDFLIADWRSFRNDPRNSIRQDCSLASGPTSTQLGLGRGWADIYTYGLDGNYVEFGENTDGRYVVRSVADASDDVLESDETDNAGYAYIEVEGSTVTVLERGQGLSPWDPRKRLADDLMPHNP